MINYVLLAYRFETCYQIALAIKKEVEDLEAAGIQVCIFHFYKFCFLVLVSSICPCATTPCFYSLQVIQIDEAALREGLPLRKSEHAFYLDWAVHSFRITNCGVQDTTQVLALKCFEIPGNLS
jgi:5-methyltetrahydropteroyltriglutamate--homocysteine methyltransferase